MDEINGNIDFQNPSENTISTKIYVSASMGQMMFSFLVMVSGTRLFDFYENEIGLNTGLVTIIFIVYALWSIVTTPLIGYFVDKRLKFWGKYGKRFFSHRKAASQERRVGKVNGGSPLYHRYKVAPNAAWHDFEKSTEMLRHSAKNLEGALKSRKSD